MPLSDVTHSSFSYLYPISMQETDYLLDMCQRFELRFVAIADRYEVSGRP